MAYNSIMRYAAFLRGFGPLPGGFIVKMSELQRCFEKAGLTDVRTVRSSGNVVFSAASTDTASLERRIEFAMKTHLDRGFLTMVRSIDRLQGMLRRDPYRAFRLKPNAKRVVTFLRDKPSSKLNLPVTFKGASIFKIEDQDVYSAYIPTPGHPVFMMLIEKTLGKGTTTRTWETIQNVVR